MISNKEVLLLGPRINGGVKEVNDSLYFGFKESKINISYINDFNAIINFFILNRKNLDNIILISSLKYGLFNILVKNSIFILHGYPYKRHLSFFDYWLNILSHFVICKLSKRTVAVSYLTKYTWENHFGLNVNKVILNPYTLGLSEFKVKKNEKNSSTSYKKVIFIGRLVKSKNVDLILSAINQLRNKENLQIQFNIIGDGPELISLKENYPHPDNIFHGYISYKDKLQILANSNAFISLNEGEPFGLTSLEASYFNLNCILPSNGGHLEFIKTTSLFLVNNIFDVSDISFQIKKAINSSKYENTLIAPNKHNPQFVAKEYYSIFNENTLDY